MSDALLKDDENALENERLTEAIDQYYTNLSNLGKKFIPVPVDLIILHKLPDTSLYIPNPAKKDEYDSWRKRAAYISQTELDTLVRKGEKFLYIERGDVPEFTQYVEAIFSEMESQSPIADEQKVGLLRKNAIQVMADIFANPTSENIDRGIKVVSGFVYTLMKDPKAYSILIGLSSHDHYTLQHSVGVATNSILLAKRYGINDEKALIEVGIGGLLHDIGKTKVPKEIINKQGPLDESEWTKMKQHALYGFEILKDNKNVSTKAKLAVLQHHEDNNGSGYPMGLSSSQVSIYAKIVGISDIYNAITTDRSYSKAKLPFEAFELIKKKMSHKVDAKLYELMVLIYGGKF